MAGWCVVGFLVAVLGSSIANPRVTFPENILRSQNRIVSGWEAEEGQFPYQISLRMVNLDGRVNGCGGTIIHPEWGLTAAHCTATRVTIVIRAGTVNLTRPESIFETTTYYNHPQYIEALQSVVQPHDIGLLKFNRVLQFTDRIQPVRLQSSFDANKDYSDVRLQASGWGRTWTSGESPENLNWVYLRGVSNAFCRGLYGSIVIDSTICASGYNVTSQSTCQGDSGGPLLVEDVDGQLTQIGISSFVSGTGCHTDFPAGFIRTGPYHEWISEVTGLNFDVQVEPTTTTVGIDTTTADSETTTAEPEPTTVSENEPTTVSEPEPTTVSEPEPTTVSESEPETEPEVTEAPSKYFFWFKF
ncbi:Collagenase [Papilio xuthus]|uniref:Collagenase n=1 Tax=Papilio xuthus TaxID=66420 RepID=A0A194Q123_PAPXU|nr:Collagenase [Papilio xuthus]